MFIIKLNGQFIGELPDDANIDALNILVGNYLFKEPVRGHIKPENTLIKALIGHCTAFFDQNKLNDPHKSFQLNYFITTPYRTNSKAVGMANTPLIHYFSKNDFENGKKIGVFYEYTRLLTIESDILQQRKAFVNQLKTLIYAFYCCPPPVLPQVPIELFQLILYQSSPSTVTLEDIVYLTNNYLTGTQRKAIPVHLDNQSTTDSLSNICSFFKFEQNSHVQSCDLMRDQKNTNGVSP
ncbi:hypothetical protein [Legionella sp. WA2022007384]